MTRAHRSSLDALPPPISRLELALRYVPLGFTHILPKGLDHVLFVLGMFLLSRKLRPILMQVSAFTIAHSITLGLSMYGIVVGVAVDRRAADRALDRLHRDREPASGELRPWRVALVFAFGLLHGLGFAGALREVGLPRSEFVTALVGFNAGVELGQLAVIGARVPRRRLLVWRPHLVSAPHRDASLRVHRVLGCVLDAAAAAPGMSTLRAVIFASCFQPEACSRILGPSAFSP